MQIILGAKKIKVCGALWLALMCCQLLLACGPEEPPQIVQDRQKWLQKIDQAEVAWKARGIKSYRLEVSYHNTPWQWGELYSLTVRNGQPVEDSFKFIARGCCKDEIPKSLSGSKSTYPGAGAFTVEGLFELARSVVKGQFDGDKTLNIEFYPDYSFPRSIFLDSKNYSDTAINWKVESFSELP